MEYPILLEEVEHFSMSVLMDKCQELRIYDEDTMESKADLKKALRQYIEENPDDIDSSFHEVLIKTVQSLSSGYRHKLDQLKEFYNEIIQMVRTADLDEKLKERLRSSFDDIVCRAQEGKNKLKRDIVPIIIAGEVSSGKSTFLNNLIGEDLLPTKLQHSTAVICRIRNSEEKVIQLTDEHGQVVKSIECNDATEAKTHLTLYADKNLLQTECQYSFVDILWPIPFLNDTLEIVDTPGIDENTKYERMVTDYIKNAASVVYMIDASNAGGLRERGVKKIKEIADIVFGTSNPEDKKDSDIALFVLNKWDCVNDEEKDDIFNEILEKLRSVWPNFSKSQVNFLDSRKDKAIRVSKVTNQRLYSRSFRELVSSVRYLIEKSFQQFISRHERIIARLLFNFGDCLNQNIRRLNKTRDRLRRIRQLQEQETKRLMDDLKLVKGRTDLQLRRICDHQKAVIESKLKNKSFCMETFRFEEWELPVWYNFLNSSSKVWNLLEKRIPEVIERILQEDEHQNCHVPELVSSLQTALREFTSNFMNSKLEARVQMAKTTHVSKAGSMHIQSEDALAVLGIGFGGSAIAARVFSRLSLTFLSRFAGGYLAFLAGASTLGTVGFGLLAAVQSVTHGFEEYKYHRNKHQYIASLATEVFEKTYMRKVANTASRNGSETVLQRCIWKIYEDVRSDIDKFFNHHLPVLLDEHKDLLQNVYLDLLQPIEMEKDLQPLMQSKENLMKKLIAFHVQNEGLLVKDNQVENEALQISGNFYDCMECTVTCTSMDSKLHAKMVAPHPDDRKGGFEGDILLWLLGCKQLRSIGTGIVSIMDIKGVVFDVDGTNKLLTAPWDMGLSDYLKHVKSKRKEENLPTDVLIEVAEEVTSGLHFLHSNGLTHRCLTGANIKVSKDGDMKMMFTLTDKYSRASAPYHCHESIKSNMKVYKGDEDVFPSLFEPTHATSQKCRIGNNKRDFRKREPEFDEYPVLPTHMAPEFIMGIERLYTKEADTYSLGILLWEITYDRRAYVCHTPLAPTSTMEEFLNFLHRGGRPDLWEEQFNPNPLKKVIESCWQQDPKRRSSSHDVLKRLKQIKATEQMVNQASLCDFLSFMESDV